MRKAKSILFYTLSCYWITRWTCLGEAKLSFTTAQKTSRRSERPKSKKRRVAATAVKFFHGTVFHYVQTQSRGTALSCKCCSACCNLAKTIWKSRTRQRRATFPSPPKLHEAPLPLQLFDGGLGWRETFPSAALTLHIFEWHTRLSVNFHIRGWCMYYCFAL